LLHAEEVLPSSTTLSLSADNLGHRLLIKQGWIPGTALGALEEPIVNPIGDVLVPVASADGEPNDAHSRLRLTAPLAPKTQMGRAGLGAITPNAETGHVDLENWKTRGRRRRWDEAKLREPQTSTNLEIVSKIT
jgi:hypothetical protein